MVEPARNADNTTATPECLVKNSNNLTSVILISEPPNVSIS